MPVQHIRVTVFRNRADAVARRAGDRLVTRTMVAVHARATVLAPVDTGNLRARMQMRKRVLVRSVRATVFNNARYAMAVHDGARPHIITPRVKQALWWPELEHPVARVRHPGVRARPFLYRALLEEAAPRGFRVSRGI